MKITMLPRFIILPLLASAFLTGAARPQTAPEVKRSVTPTDISVSATLPVGTVTERSPTINAKEVGRVVAPGVLEINPTTVLNKRILLTPGDPAARIICIGFWRKGACAGIYIENPSKG